MRYIIQYSLILISISISGQNDSNSFQIGDHVEVFNNDSILIYYNCTGTVVEKKCAEFYRKGRIDSANINITGKFKDYYMSGLVALEANITGNYLNGEATYFYENGAIKSQGNYLDDIKTGIWTYYYSNSQKEKVINFVDTYPYVLEYYKRTGKQKVIDGNGKYRGEFYPYLGCSPFSIWGKIRDGKMQGKWNIDNFGYEYFENGLFVTDTLYKSKYPENQKIFINGFYANENVHLEDNMMGCPGDNGIFFLKYKEASLHEAFYPEILQIFRAFHIDILKNQWLIVGLNVNSLNELTSVNVKSSIDDKLVENEIFNIITSMKSFSSAKMNGENIDFDLFFTILIKDNQFIIPTEYFYRNR